MIQAIYYIFKPSPLFGTRDFHFSTLNLIIVFRDMEIATPESNYQLPTTNYLLPSML